MGGLLHLAGDADGPPVWMGFAMSDIAAGLLALSGTLAALRDRDRTGQGRRVDISMLDAALLMNDLPMAYRSAVGGVMGRGGYSLQTPWGPFPTTDGYVAIAVISDAQWRALCGAIERPDLATRADLATGRDRSLRARDVVDPAVAAWTSQRTRAEVTEALTACSVPAAPVNTADDLLDDPAVLARDMLIEVEDPAVGPVRVVGNPIKLDGVPAPSGRRIPRLGEHTADVLDELFGVDAP
jgi:formyl-CoA transferase